MQCTLTMTKEQAIENGYTKEMYGQSRCNDLAVLMKPDTDLDDVFLAVCTDTYEVLRVHGYNYTWEDVLAA